MLSFRALQFSITSYNIYRISRFYEKLSSDIQTTATMGKPTQPPYKDDPDAVSMHTTPDDYEYAEPSASTDDLPSYNDSEAAASSSTVSQNITSTTAQAAQPEPYNVIANPLGPQSTYSKPANPGAVTIRMDERLNDPAELYSYITDYMRAMPPRPIVRIYGWHHETVRRKDKKEQERVADFDITFSFQQYLSRSEERRVRERV